jgi:hypothetical protein
MTCPDRGFAKSHVFNVEFNSLFVSSTEQFFFIHYIWLEKVAEEI